MIQIFYTRLSGPLPDNLYYDYLLRLPQPLRERNQGFRRWEDKLLHLFGNILLIKGLEAYGLDQASLGRISYNSHGRPGLDEPVGLDFNITHSGAYVLCALGWSVRLGIDIEHIVPIPFTDFENVLTRDQWRSVFAASDTFRRFFYFWTIKESVIKADGRGLDIPLSDITIDDGTASFGDSIWYHQPVHIDAQYSACLSTDSGHPFRLSYVDCY